MELWLKNVGPKLFYQSRFHQSKFYQLRFYQRRYCQSRPWQRWETNDISFNYPGT